MAKDDKATDAKPKPKKKPLMLYAIIGVVVLVLLGGGGFFAWKKFSAPKAENQAAASGNQETKGTHGGGGAKAEGQSGTGTEGGGTITLEPFLVNLADQDANRYLKASIRILVVEAETGKKIAENEVIMPRLRDTILSILSTKVANEIINNDGKVKLKKEILEKVNEFLPGKCAKDIFFTDFVVQL